MPSPRLAVLALALLFGVTAAAQPPDTSAPRKAALESELERVQGRLDAVQERALLDSGLLERSNELVADVERRMVEIDPQTSARLRELDEVKARLTAARAARDREAFEAAAAQGRSISAGLEATRTQVLAEPIYARRTQALQQALVEEMTRLDPEVPDLLARLRLLGERLAGD